MAELEHPDHPILTAPWTYEVVGLRYNGTPCGADDHILELTLTKESETVRLRFLQPGGLRINEGFPTQLGLFISDISSKGWEGIAIEVGDFENQTIHFYAKSVERC